MTIQLWDNEHSKRLMRAPPLEPVKAFFKQTFKDNHDVKVLDVGCGAGSNTLWLTEANYHVWAFDSSVHAINRLLDAAISQQSFRFLQGCTIADVTKPWPYKSDTFDVVLDVRCLENITERILYCYEQAARVLKPNGWLLSITACEHRKRKATVGESKNRSDRVISTILSEARLTVHEISHWHGDGTNDLVIAAKKP